MFVYATMIALLTSCGGGGGKTTTDSTRIDSTTVNVEPIMNTIVTTPQNMLVIKHKVADFAKWKIGYDEHDSARLANKLHNYVIGRGMEDPNMVFIALKAEDMDKAKAFSKDAGLKNAMGKAGVLGTPSFSFVTMTFQDTAIITSDIRSSAMFTVKDWDAWQNAFEEGKQERMDNGIIVRAYGHDADDNHKVMLVTALMDTAKANAYMKSDILKNRRVAAGVIGEPVRFMFRVVQRY